MTSVRLNNENSANDDSGNILMRICVASSGAGGYVMVVICSGDSGTGGSIGMSSDNDGGLSSLASDSSSFSNREAVTMVGDESLVSNGGDTNMSAGLSTSGSG